VFLRVEAKMPTAIEMYHGAKLAVDAANRVVEGYVEKLKGVITGLDLSTELLLQPVRYPYEEEPRDRTGDEMVMTKPLEEMPTREMIFAALLALDKAHKDWRLAYGALSDVEKTYVGEPQDQRHIRMREATRLY
jgi:hypothetical protein